MENTKRDLSLDFTKPRIPRGQPAPSLVTPILNLSTPELNKMISEEELAVLTPNGISSVISQPNVLPSPLIPTTVNNSNIITTGNNGNANNNTNTNNHYHNGNNAHPNGNGRRSSSADSNGTSNKQNVRQEIDLEKIEKKRERNRLAAKKCRQRKLETIDELRKDVMQWENKYNKLQYDFEQFKNLRNKEIEALRRENSELQSLLRRK